MNDAGRESPTAEEEKGWRFYAVLFRDSRFTAGIVCYFLFALFISSFECTLAVHVRDTFGWGVFHVGLLMASIQGPGIVLGPLVGYMKDRVGSRTPTMIGFLSLSPFLFLLGVPGSENMPWANVGIRGKVIYATCMTIIGCLTCLLNGVGMMEATGKAYPNLSILSLEVIAAHSIQKLLTSWKPSIRESLARKEAIVAPSL